MKGETANCYTGITWNTTICPDAQTCSQNCVIEGAGAECTSTYGVHGNGNSLHLDFVTQGPCTKNICSSTYFMKDDYAYQLLQLKNKESIVTVDVSTLDCGLNGALYVVQMDADGGESKYGNAGADMDLGYAAKYGICCTEIDTWLAKRMSMIYTMHSWFADAQGTLRTMTACAVSTLLVSSRA